MGKISCIFFGITLLLSILFPFFPLATYVSGQESNHFWESQIIQSNESWPQMVIYQERDVFYQDEYLEMTLNLSHIDILTNYDNFTQYEFVIESGTIFETEDGDYYYYGTNDDMERLTNQYPTSMDSIYILKPFERDINFRLSVNFYVSDQYRRIYHEEHIFWIVGEPVIIPRISPNDNLNIMVIYLGSISVSIFIIAIIHLKLNIISKRRG